MHNFLILFLQVLVVSTFSLISLRIGEKALNAWLCVVAVAMNLFVMKQITLCGWEVTATDALAVGYMLGLNLLQEYYGKIPARIHVFLAFICSFGFILLSQIHLIYVPNHYDHTHAHFEIILGTLPRLLMASLVSFVIVQLVDITFFAWLREKIGTKRIFLRFSLSLALSQILDTFIFTFLGLYGLVGNIFHILIVSLLIKGVIILLTAPYSTLSKFLSVNRQYTPVS